LWVTGVWAALAGERTRFSIEGRAFQVLPVVDVDGMVRYGVLIEGAAISDLTVALRFTA
jgi:hypothetical protein